jgi:hypothetical protein
MQQALHSVVGCPSCAQTSLNLAYVSLNTGLWLLCPGLSALLPLVCECSKACTTVICLFQQITGSTAHSRCSVIFVRCTNGPLIWF